MSTWCDRPARGSVLRGGAATTARPARLDSDLRTTPFASLHAVDARLTDPHLEQVVDDARRDAVEQGRAQGHVAGYAAGLAVAAAEAEQAERERAQRAAQEQAGRDAELLAALDVLAATTQALQRREAVAVAEVERVVVELAVQVAQAVLGRELAVATDPGLEAVTRALQLAPHGTAAVARLHPDDVASLGAAEHLRDLRELVVVPDPGVERGGCVVETAGRRIDAQVGPALERVAAVLA